MSDPWANSPPADGPNSNRARSSTNTSRPPGRPCQTTSVRARRIWSRQFRSEWPHSRRATDNHGSDGNAGRNAQARHVPTLRRLCAYAKARQDMMRDKYRDEHPILDAVGNAVGGIATGVGIANAGRTLVKAGQGFHCPARRRWEPRAQRMGGITGFNEGDGLEGRLKARLQGRWLGSLSAGSPVVGAVGKAALAPAISNYQAWRDPAAAAGPRSSRLV